MAKSKPISSVIVLGGGSAGFISAITLKTKLPDLDVRVVHSSKLGIIGVGEGSTFTLPIFFHGYLGIHPKAFHEAVHPTYKLGIRFLWGPRPFFHYTFTNQLDARHLQQPKPNGFYCRDEFDYADPTSAMMAHGRAFERQQDGAPLLTTSAAYHVENERLVGFLQQHAQSIGVQIVDDLLQDVDLDERGVAGLRMESGEKLEADFYVDCSGFRSELIGRAFDEPFIDFSSSLFCDRAVAGGWQRTDEPLRPFTTSETMDAGWCWQIEHEPMINRGYVYSSSHISDADAEAEFRRKNPKVGETRVIKFVSGRYRHSWVKNAVAIGNASGFVEPLEATALAVICEHAATVVRSLIDSDRLLKASQIEMFNRYNENMWSAVRRFLAMHYKFNTRSDTPFWRDCVAKTDLAGAEPMVEYYQRNGPSVLWANHLLPPADPFGWEGYLAMLVGQQVEYDNTHVPTDHELAQWRQYKQQLRDRALGGFPQEEALHLMRSERWSWREGFYEQASLTRW